MKRCPTCGNIVPAGHGRKRKQKYCSVVCYRNRDLGLDKAQVLELLNKTDNVEMTAGLLGTYKQRIYGFIKRNRIHRIVSWKVGI